METKPMNVPLVPHPPEKCRTSSVDEVEVGISTQNCHKTPPPPSSSFVFQTPPVNMNFNRKSRFRRHSIVSADSLDKKRQELLQWKVSKMSDEEQSHYAATEDPTCSSLQKHRDKMLSPLFRDHLAEVAKKKFREQQESIREQQRIHQQELLSQMLSKKLKEVERAAEADNLNEEEQDTIEQQHIQTDRQQDNVLSLKENIVSEESSTSSSPLNLNTPVFLPDRANRQSLESTFDLEDSLDGYERDFGTIVVNGSFVHFAFLFLFLMFVVSSFVNIEVYSNNWLHKEFSNRFVETNDVKAFVAESNLYLDEIMDYQSKLAQHHSLKIREEGSMKLNFMTNLIQELNSTSN